MPTLTHLFRWIVMSLARANIMTSVVTFSVIVRCNSLRRILNVVSFCVWVFVEKMHYYQNQNRTSRKHKVGIKCPANLICLLYLLAIFDVEIVEKFKLQCPRITIIRLNLCLITLIIIKKIDERLKPL